MTPATSRILTPPAARRAAAAASAVVSPHLRFRRMGSTFVFLCLRTGRYFLLRDGSARRFERFTMDHAAPADLDWLRQREFIVGSAVATEPGTRLASPPRSSILDLQLPAPSVLDIGLAAAAQMKARRDLRLRPLGAIVTALEQREVIPEPASPTACLKIAAAFYRARRYFPAIDQCLVRGLAMKRLLDGQGLQTDFVIGVKLPFSAHCWVQADDTVLTDPLDVVLPFEQILVI